MRRTARRRPGGRRGRSRFARRSVVKRRSTRKRTPRLTRRKILEITSTKKNDTFPSMGTTVAGSADTSIPGISGATLWCPTFLEGTNKIVSPHIRNSQDVYWKGFSETFTMNTDTSDPFKWRRIVFQLEGGPNATGLPVQVYVAAKTDFDLEQPLAGSTAFPTNPFPIDYVWRYRRAMVPMTDTEFGILSSGLFQGQSGIDYNDYLTARTDNRIKVISDVTRHITSGNDSGIMKTYKFYTPLNKTMRYADAESGSTTAANGYAAMNSPLNDVYVMDYYQQLPNAPNTLTIRSQAKIYWHEK
ncbi:MAG: capsid protein [Genomoviridae sp.]|nr:MAG: capsid protein [Genomoviridae sp.]